MASPIAEQKRLNKELKRKRERERMSRVRVDVFRSGEAVPAWAEKRATDMWIWIELPEAANG